MSLILEALHKAEQRSGTPHHRTTPQAHSPDQKTFGRGWLLLGVITVCLTSAAVTLLVIRLMGPGSGEALQTRTKAHDGQEPPAVLAEKRPEPAPPQPPLPHRSPAEERRATPSSPAPQSAPGFDHLIGRRGHETEASPGLPDRTPETAVAAPPTERPAAPAPTGIQNTAPPPEPLQLADMEIHVHMYSETPAKRFVYINAVRYSENTWIGDGIFLDEITKNGIILNINGTRYRMPLKP